MNPQVWRVSSLVLIFLLFLLWGISYLVPNPDRPFRNFTLDFPLAEGPGPGGPLSFLGSLESPVFHLRHHEGEHSHRLAVLKYRHWIFGFGVDLDFPVSGWNQAYHVGGGENFEVSYLLNPRWVMGLGLTVLGYSGSFFGQNLTDRDVNLHLLTRLFWNDGGIRPYVTAQAGGVWETAKAGSETAQDFNPRAGVGGGVELGLDSNVKLFGEALFDFTLSPNGTAWDIPFSSGMRLSL